MPGVVFDPASKGALAFIEFAREMAARADALRAAPVHDDPAADLRARRGLLSRIEDAGINASAPRAAALGRRLAGALLARQGEARALHPGGRGRPARLDEQAGALPAALRRRRPAAYRAHHAVLAAGRARRASRRRSAWSGSTTRGSWSLASLDTPFAARRHRCRGDVRFERVDAEAFAEWVGRLRGSPAERAARARRAHRACRRCRITRFSLRDDERRRGRVRPGRRRGRARRPLRRLHRRGGARAAVTPSASAASCSRYAAARRRDASAICRSTPATTAARSDLPPARLRRRLRVPLPDAPGAA